MRLVLSLILSLGTFNAWSLDFNFRFKSKYCQKNRQPGWNPNFWGECGDLTSARIINKNFENLNLKGANLNSTYTYVSYFKEGDLSYSSWRRAVIMQARFKNVFAEFIDLRGSQLKGVHFTDSKIKKLLATGSRMIKTKFIDCDLQEAYFFGSLLQQVDFSGSDLRGADLSSTFILLSNFKGAQFNDKTKLPFSEDEAIKRGMVKVD